jgi:hypothetical protein
MYNYLQKDLKIGAKTYAYSIWEWHFWVR